MGKIERQIEELTAQVELRDKWVNDRLIGVRHECLYEHMVMVSFVDKHKSWEHLLADVDCSFRDNELRSDCASAYRTLIDASDDRTVAAFHEGITGQSDYSTPLEVLATRALETSRQGMMTPDKIDELYELLDVLTHIYDEDRYRTKEEMQAALDRCDYARLALKGFIEVHLTCRRWKEETNKRDRP